MSRRVHLTTIDTLAPSATLAQASRALRTALEEAGVDSPALDARLLLCEAGGLGGADLIGEPERALGAPALVRLRALARRRVAREPVSRILGRREFWGLPLALSPAALDPRPDTETLVEAALDALAARRGQPLRILDMGAGSGAILCALLSELPNAWGVALDISPAAAALARANLAAQGFAARSRVVVGDWGEALEGRFDVVVSNPPYIASGEIAGLAPEVSLHDPVLALDGGRDGLDAYRAIGAVLGRLLEPRAGVFFLEIGAGQAGDVTGLLAGAQMKEMRVLRDLSGRERVVAGKCAVPVEFAIF